MRFCTALVLLLVTATEPVNGFAVVSRRCCGSPLQGLLDDFESGQSADTSATSSPSSESSAHETLFEDLVFSTNDPLIAVQNRWDGGCSDPEFETFLANKMETAEDDDERQAYQELLAVVGEVRKEQDAVQAEIEAAAAAKEEAKRQREEEIAASTQGPEATQMSAAEVLKSAQKIQQGAMSKEGLEEEGPSNFMRDAKATVGLSGFNNKGRMRVGGD